MPLVDRYATSATVLSGAILILGLAIVNGAPFVYFDTPFYIDPIARAIGTPILHSQGIRIESGTGVAGGYDLDTGRSVYYGVLGWLGWVSSLWVPIVVQAVTLSWLVVTLFRLGAKRWWRRSALLTLAGLAFLSSAGLFAGLIMPDIWVGIMVLAMALLWVYADRLTRLQTVLILAVTVYAALVHSSHFLLLLAMTVLLAMTRLFVTRQTRAPLARLGYPVIALCIGLAGQTVYVVTARMVEDVRLFTRPHISAHLVDLGPGTQLVRDSCPDSGFALCAYADRLPVTWIKFLFDSDPKTGVFAAAPHAVQDDLVAEQIRFAVQTLSTYPVQTLSGLGWDGISQLWTLKISTVALTEKYETFVDKWFPPVLADTVKNSRMYDRGGALYVLWRTIKGTSAAATALLLIYGAWRIYHSQPSLRALDRVILLMVAGVVLNALICGILASPYGRFQARIVWLLPLAAAFMVTSTVANPGTRIRHPGATGT